MSDNGASISYTVYAISRNVSECSDPLKGKMMPTLTLTDLKYNPQSIVSKLMD